MTPADRRERILSLLRAMQQELRVEELTGILGVSALTVRRDLTALERTRSVIRTHGGCLAAGRAAFETDYHQKVARNFALKQAIGRTAAAMVKPGSTILLNDGSTTFHLVSSIVSGFVGSLVGSPVAARAGRGGPLLTIYTNSIAALAEVARCPGIVLYLIGGRYRDEDYSLQGSFAESALDSLRVDAVFLGADAVDDAGKCLVPTPEEARLTRTMLKCGRRAILLADHTKVGAASTIAYGSLTDMSCWITTPGIERSLLRRYRKLTSVTEAPM